MPFPTAGQWLRCQLHSHTTCSDGEATIQGLIEHYHRAGCDVLSITDHWGLTRGEHPSMLLLPGSELSARRADGREAEVLAYGIEELPEPREEFPSIDACARWVVEHGGVGYLAHPYWSSLGPEDYLSAPDLAGIEVWNGGSELASGNGLSTVHWDDILGRGAACLGIATDDCHYPGQDSRLGWTMVRVAERSVAAVVAALRKGDCYGTSGPTIEAIEVRPDGTVDVRCSPARSVTLRSGIWDGCRANADPFAMSWHGEVLERTPAGEIVAARLGPPEWNPWGRVEVRAADGGVAWSNPFPLTPQGTMEVRT